MIIIPAIDLIDGKVVRLEQGNYEKDKIYSDDPSDIAKQWADKGAKLLHVVDLDGARTGKTANLRAAENIVSIVGASGVRVEFGGGVRDADSMKRVFDAGVSIVILGTSVLKDKEFSLNALKKYGGNKIVFSMDIKGRDILAEGWRERPKFRLSDLISVFESNGLRRMIYTDIARDGMLKGPNFIGIRSIVSQTKLEVIAAGGISSIDDVRKLKELENDGLKGAIIGKALYEGKIDLEEAINIAG